MMKVQVLATGREFLRRGVRGFEPVIAETIASAKTEIQMVTYILTPSALPLLDLVSDAAERGVRVTVIVQRGKSRSRKVREWIASAPTRYEALRVIEFGDLKGTYLHAKTLVADRRRAVLGSANLSWGGMAGNYEIGVMIEGEPVWKIAELIDDLVALAEESE